MIKEKVAVLQIIGSLMRQPSLLSESDKYFLTTKDFPDRFTRYIFSAITQIYGSGGTQINPIDVESALMTNAVATEVFKENKGIEYLQDAFALSDVNTFPYYYSKLKKVNLLNDLAADGFDIKDFYCEVALKPEEVAINNKFESLTTDDILNKIKTKLLGLEHNYITNDTTEVQSAIIGLEDLIAAAKQGEDVGLPLQGLCYNEVTAGARLGTLYIRSAGSGVGKTINSVADACGLAYPLRFNQNTWKWELNGYSEKVLFIATEQDFGEIQKIILSYLTGINSKKFRYGDFTRDEEIVVKQAIAIMQEFEENFYIVRMPNPTIGGIKTIIRENVLIHDIKYVFYDYIFISPSLLSEFKGFNLRNDKILSYI